MCPRDTQIFILNKLKNCAPVNTWVLNLMANLVVQGSAVSNSNYSQQHILSMISLGNRNVKNMHHVAFC